MKKVLRMAGLLLVSMAVWGCGAHTEDSTDGQTMQETIQETVQETVREEISEEETTVCEETTVSEETTACEKEIVELSEQELESVRDAYVNVIVNICIDYKWPDRTDMFSSGLPENLAHFKNNECAFYDIDQDGMDELLIWVNPETIEGGLLRIYQYNRKRGIVEESFDPLPLELPKLPKQTWKSVLEETEKKNAKMEHLLNTSWDAPVEALRMFIQELGLAIFFDPDHDGEFAFHELETSNDRASNKFLLTDVDQDGVPEVLVSSPFHDRTLYRFENHEVIKVDLNRARITGVGNDEVVQEANKRVPEWEGKNLTKPNFFTEARKYLEQSQ